MNQEDKEILRNIKKCLSNASYFYMMLDIKYNMEISEMIEKDRKRK